MENETRTMQRKNFYIAIFALSVVSIVLITGGCGKKKDTDEKAKRIEEAIKSRIGDSRTSDYKQEVQNFRLEGFSKDKKNRWSVEGQFANIVEPDIVLKSIKGASLSEKLSVNITADRGIYNKRTKSAELKGNVVVILSDGGKVFMDSAVWNAGDEEVTTKSPIRIEHSGIILEGVGAMVMPQKKWAVINKNVRMSDKNDRVITCDGPMEVDYENRQAILKNNVEIIDTEGKMYADQVIAYFDADKREIERIEWLGNVKAVY